MAKPHEETWSVRVNEENYEPAVYLQMPDEREYLFGDYDRGCSSDPTMDPESNDADRERARLAAQAPAMARMLLEIFDTGYPQSHPDDSGGNLCWSCDAQQRFGPKLGISPKEPGSWIYHPIEHKPDCALAELLRDAGVL